MKIVALAVAKIPCGTEISFATTLQNKVIWTPSNFHGWTSRVAVEVRGDQASIAPKAAAAGMRGIDNSSLYRL